jgi:hypothetical protein
LGTRFLFGRVLSLILVLGQAADREFLIRVSYMEIYNEEINDLLTLRSEKLPIHESLEVNARNGYSNFLLLAVTLCKDLSCFYSVVCMCPVCGKKLLTMLNKCYNSLSLEKVPFLSIYRRTCSNVYFHFHQFISFHFSQQIDISEKQT